MSTTLRFDRDDGTTVEVCVTDPADGDFALETPSRELSDRREGIMAGNWSVVRQVHGNAVVDADPSTSVPTADAIITGELHRPIAVLGADCAPIALVTDRGPIGVAHVGWKGLQACLLDAAIDRIEANGSVATAAVVGPLIGAECYEFSPEQLEQLAGDLGQHVSGSTRGGRPALDLIAGVRGQLEQRGVENIEFVGGCTACEGAGFSHRARSERERHTVVAQIVPR